MMRMRMLLYGNNEGTLLLWNMFRVQLFWGRNMERTTDSIRASVIFVKIKLILTSTQIKDLSHKESRESGVDSVQLCLKTCKGRMETN